jgi:hypothetical protein
VPDLPWRGRYLEVTVDRDVKWRRCAVCGRPLTDPFSCELGVGPDCRRTVDEADQEDALDRARHRDRMRWRHGLDAEMTDAEVLRRVASRPTREQEARWEVLQAALRRRQRPPGSQQDGP